MEVVIYVIPSLYVVMYFLVLSSERDILLKENSITIPTKLFTYYLVYYTLNNMLDQLLTLGIGFEDKKVTSAPRKIVAVQHSILTINVVIHMIRTNILSSK